MTAPVITRKVIRFLAETRKALVQLAAGLSLLAGSTWVPDKYRPWVDGALVVLGYLGVYHVPNAKRAPRPGQQLALGSGHTLPDLLTAMAIQTPVDNQADMHDEPLPGEENL